MSDPLERLGSVPDDGRRPDLGAIRARAGRIQQRRRAMLGATAAGAVAALIVVAAVVLPAGSPDVSTVADGRTGSVERTTEDLRDGEDAASVPGGAGAGGSMEADDGGSTAPLADAPKAAGGAAASRSKDGPSAESSTALEVTVAVSGAPTTPRFALRVCNPSRSSVEASFNDAKRFDFEVYEPGGRESVWRWSDGRAFAQVIGSERWGPGECRDGGGGWSDSWNGDADGRKAPPGTYEVVGVLASGAGQRSARVSFCWITCG